MNRRLLVLLILLVVSIIVMGSVYLFVETSSNQKNGFNRVSIHRNVEFIGVVDLRFNSYYISGVTTSNVYLGNYTAPLHALIVDYTNFATREIAFPHLDTSNIAWQMMKLSVDSPVVYMMEGVTPSINTALLGKEFRESELPKIPFSACVPISESSFVVRSILNSPPKNVLLKIVDGVVQKTNENLLDTHSNDDLFSTEGTLHYNSTDSSLIYVYHYRNGFLHLDSNLNIIRRPTTIDTFTQARVKVVANHDGSRYRMSSPPSYVNKYSCTAGEYVFINSAVKADNEGSELFKQFSTIDVYSLKNGKYCHSFYLQNYKGYKLRNFFVRDSFLLAIMENYLLIYKI